MRAIRQPRPERLEARVVLSAAAPASGGPNLKEVGVVLNDDMGGPADIASVSNASSLAFAEHDIMKLEVNKPVSAIPSDLDSDGDMDLLVAAEDDGKIVWYENTDGKGSFESQHVIRTDIDGSWGMSTYPADVDGDGDVDVLWSSWRDYTIAWQENIDGNGTFSEPRVIDAAPAGVGWVIAADMDADGHLDAVTVQDDDTIVWYKNSDGLGAFGEQRVIENLSNVFGIWALAAEDIDGDGDTDLVVASDFPALQDKIFWLENIGGGGTFGPERLIVSGLDADRVASLSIADVDGDGDMDVVSSSRRNFGRVAWYENTDGQGAFGPQSVIAIDSYSSVVAADMDGDGDVDVLTSPYVRRPIAWHENTDGQGTFGPATIISTLEAVSYTASIHAVDLNNDGALDVLTAVRNKIAWYRNGGDGGTFGPQQVITGGIGGPVSVVAADMDGDGVLDVLAASGDGVYRCNLNGNEFTIISLYTYGADSVVAADVDGDGDMDVLSARHHADKIAWYENADSQGTFGIHEEQVITVEADFASAVFAEDLDGDGDLDVLSASQEDDKIAWYENTDGQGTFGPQLVISSEALGAISVYAVDVDGDGDQDVLSASHADDKIAWYENTDGNGTFGPQRVISTDADVANTVIASDLDGDGDPDVLSTSFADDKIAWYENMDGLGTFGPQRVISTTADGARSVYAADMDRDGDFDVISASYRDNKVAWYENTDGSGTFGSEIVISTVADGAHSVFAADMDADGDMDVLATAHEGDRVIWFESRIAGDFDDDGDVDTADRTILTQNWTGALMPGEGDKTFDQGDTDGDGDVDAADQTRLIQNWTGALQQAQTSALVNVGFMSSSERPELSERDALFSDQDFLEDVLMGLSLRTSFFLA